MFLLIRLMALMIFRILRRRTGALTYGIIFTCGALLTILYGLISPSLGSSSYGIFGSIINILLVGAGLGVVGVILIIAGIIILAHTEPGDTLFDDHPTRSNKPAAVLQPTPASSIQWPEHNPFQPAAPQPNPLPEQQFTPSNPWGTVPQQWNSPAYNRDYAPYNLDHTEQSAARGDPRWPNQM
jgi:hypothetical protein